jgi:MFS family permease
MAVSRFCFGLFHFGTFQDLEFTIFRSTYLQICFYSTSFFQSASLTLEQASYGTIGVFIVNAIFTFVSMAVMDRAGRRPLQLYGLAGMWASSILITVSLLFKASIGKYHLAKVRAYPGF